MNLRITTLIALLLAFPASAEIYKSVDEHGNVVFTDNPKSKNAKEVILPQTNTQPAVETNASQTTLKPGKQKSTAESYTLTIDSPGDGSHIPPGQQTVNMSISMSPDLAPEHRLQATLNGSPFGNPVQTNTIDLQNLYRGTHQLGVQVLGPKGEVLSQSNTVTIYVQRISLNSPARKQTP